MTTQGIEARSGETGTGSTEGESPSGKAGAPKLDWTAPLMLDDGSGVGVDLGHVQCLVPGYGLTGYNADGTHVPGTLPRIINRPKPDAEPVEQLPADEPDTVTVPRMTEAEIAALTNKVLPNKAWTPEIANAHYKGASEVLRALGATRKPTPLDRFTASHPNWRDLDKEEAVRLALEQRGEG